VNVLQYCYNRCNQISQFDTYNKCRSCHELSPEKESHAERMERQRPKSKVREESKTTGAIAYEAALDKYSY